MKLLKQVVLPIVSLGVMIFGISSLYSPLINIDNPSPIQSDNSRNNLNDNLVGT